MTPAEIAAKLTPAQVRALRLRADDRAYAKVHSHTQSKLWEMALFWASGRPTDLGRAVLAELDAKGGGGK